MAQASGPAAALAPKTTASDEPDPNTEGDDKDDKPSGGWLRNLPLTTLICVAILIMGLGVRIFDPPMVESSALRRSTFTNVFRLARSANIEWALSISTKPRGVGQWPGPERPSLKCLTKRTSWAPLSSVSTLSLPSRTACRLRWSLRTDRSRRGHAQVIGKHAE